MTREEYKDYETRVNAFYEREGIDYFSLSVTEELESQECKACLEIRDFEPHFSHYYCECCSRPLAGDRYHVIAHNKEHDLFLCYDVCTDCYYYNEYGTLDDMTMLEIEES